MIDEPGGGTRSALPLVLGGRVTAEHRAVPLRTLLGSTPRSARARRLTLGWWATVAWGVALLMCASTAFAIRDTMFPDLGRTEPPSAWQAPTRPTASVAYADREGPLPTGAATVSLPPGAAAAGVPLGIVAAEDATDTAADDANVDVIDLLAPTSATLPTSASSDPAVRPGVPVATASPTNTAPSASPDVSAPTTSDATTTTVAAAPDDSGNQRGRGGAGGVTTDTLP